MGWIVDFAGLVNVILGLGAASMNFYVWKKTKEAWRWITFFLALVGLFWGVTYGLIVYQSVTEHIHNAGSFGPTLVRWGVTFSLVAIFFSGADRLQNYRKRHHDYRR